MKIQQLEVRANGGDIGEVFIDTPLIRGILKSVIVETDKSANILIETTKGIRVFDHKSILGTREYNIRKKAFTGNDEEVYLHSVAEMCLFDILLIEVRTSPHNLVKITLRYIESED